MKNVVFFLNDCCGGGGGGGGLLGTSACAYSQRLWRNIKPCYHSSAGSSSHHHLVNRTLPKTSVSENISKQNSYYGNDTVRNGRSRDALKVRQNTDGKEKEDEKSGKSSVQSIE